MNVNITPDQTNLLLDLLTDRIAKLHNHIASAVEDPKGHLAPNTSLPSPFALLRECQNLAANIRRARNEAEGYQS
jgi:hypothetical protein